MSTVRVAIQYEGTEQGAAQIARLQENLRGADDAQRRATTSSRALSQSAGTMGQNMGRLGAAVGGAAAALSGLDGGLGALGRTIGQTSSALGGLSGSLGPLGLALGAVTVALGIYEESQRRAREEAAESQRTVDRLTRSYDELHGAIVRARTERERSSRLERGVGTQDEMQAALAEARNLVQAREIAIRNLTQNREMDRETRQLELRRRVAERNAAQRRAAFFEQQLSGGVFIEEPTAQGEGFTDRLPEDRAGRRGGRSRSQRTPSFAEQEAEAWQRAQDGARLYASIVEEIDAEANARALAQASIDTQLHDNQMERMRIEREATAAHYDQIRNAEEELRAKQAEAFQLRRREQASLAQEASGYAKQIGTAYFDAFMIAIEGTMSLEDAMIQATKELLKQIGMELVARGIGKILEGIAEIPSPTAATKIGGGAAMVGFGVGLGAAGAAIPSPQQGGAEQPREDRPSGEAGGPREITVVFGNPVLTAGTQTQLARGMGRALSADRSFPNAVG